MGGAIDIEYDPRAMNLLSSGGFALPNMHTSAVCTFQLLCVVGLGPMLLTEAGYPLHNAQLSWRYPCLCDLLQQLLRHVARIC